MTHFVRLSESMMAGAQCVFLFIFIYRDYTDMHLNSLCMYPTPLPLPSQQDHTAWYWYNGNFLHCNPSIHQHHRFSRTPSLPISFSFYATSASSEHYYTPLQYFGNNDETHDLSDGWLTLEGIKQFFVAVEKEDWKFNTLCGLYDTLTITQAVIFWAISRIFLLILSLDRYWLQQMLGSWHQCTTSFISY